MSGGEFNAEMLQALMASEQEKDSAKSLYDHQDMSKLIETYMTVDIPRELKQHKLLTDFWAVLDRNIKLTFLREEDVEDSELLFEVAKVNYLQSRPAYTYTLDDVQLLDQLKIYFLAAIKRSVGIGQHKFNERIIQGGTTNHVIRSNTDTIQSGSSGGGWFSKLKSKI